MDAYIKKVYIESIFKYFFSMFFAFTIIENLANILFGHPLLEINDSIRIIYDFLCIFLSSIFFTSIFSFACKYEKKVLNLNESDIESIISTLTAKGFTREIGTKDNILYKSNIQKFYFGKIFIYDNIDSICIYASKPLLKYIMSFIEQ